MNFQHLKHFVAVAEELHFGRAADRLGMAQPPLSQSIQRLEASLGCSLFTRKHRRIELTPAGESLLQHSTEILNLVSYARRSALAASRVGLSSVTIGFTPNSITESVPQAMIELRRHAPDVKIKLQEGTSQELVDAILTGMVDLAFVAERGTQVRGLEVRQIDRVRHVLAVHEDSPLATKETIVMRDLEKEALILVPEKNRPDYRAALAAAFRSAELQLHVDQEAVFDHTRLRMVAAGLGCTFVSEAAAPRGFAGVVLRRVADLPGDIATGQCIAWRSAAAHNVRKVFEQIYQRVNQARRRAAEAEQ